MNPQNLMTAIVGGFPPDPVLAGPVHRGKLGDPRLPKSRPRFRR